ncbi:MAG: hypothetical protein LQ351_008019 [Letrouitia transgressa]|nr:MAG: hypothetical protein LQ351_008019 [Letrouitia transgressa]
MTTSENKFLQTVRSDELGREVYWSFSDTDLDCILLANYGAHENELYNRENCLELLKFKDPQKYEKYDKTTLFLMTCDVVGRLTPYFDNLGQGNPRIERIKGIFRQKLLDSLHTRLEVADTLHQIPVDARNTIVMAGNQSYQHAKDWHHVAKGLNNLHQNYPGRRKPFNATNLEIIYRYIMAMDFKQYCAVRDCQNSDTFHDRMKELDEEARK